MLPANQAAPQLWAAFQRDRDPAVRSQLAMCYGDLVRSVAATLAGLYPGALEQDDLCSIGFLGLVEAIDRFDPARSVPFEAYARWRVRGSMLDALRAHHPLPPSWQRRMRQLADAEARLSQELMRSPSAVELAHALGWSLADVRQGLAYSVQAAVLSLDEFLFDPISESAPDRLEDPLTQVIEAERTALLRQAIERLGTREQQVIALFYVEELSTKEIAEVLSVSAARVSQIHQRAVLRLRGFLGRRKAELFGPL